MAFIEDIVELKAIGIEAYALSCHDHWNEGGLIWYLDNEFSHSRLALDLSDQNTDYYFIEYKGKQIGFIKIKFSLPPSFIEYSVVLE